MTFQIDPPCERISTYYAPAMRAPEAAMLGELQTLTQNPIINTILANVSGLFAVLNEERQILALNDTFIQKLGIDDVAKVFGLRLGEAINCVNANKQPNGCGTTRYCMTCGAAIASVTSLVEDIPIESECIATVQHHGMTTDIYLHIRCCPIKFNHMQFILMFLRDETINQQRAVLERAFLHDVTNTIAALQINAELKLGT